MRKILLVSLRNKFLDSDRVMPPLGVMSLYSFLKSKGVHCDLTNDVENVDLSQYTHVGISCTTPEFEEAVKLKNKLPKGTKSIIGGPHTTFYWDECLDFDYVVVGDGEYALKEIMNGDPIDKVIEQPIPEEVLNSFPLPYRAPEFLTQYSFDIRGTKASTLLTAKGCPMQCGFCESATTMVRLYSPEYVGRQIDQIKEAGFPGVMFFDDLFTLSKKRVIELTNVIKKKNIIYRCFGHAKLMTPEIADMLVDSGCVEIGFGAESGSQKILDVVGKHTKIEQNFNFVRICNERNLKVKAFLMVGLPSESPKTISETETFLDFLMRNHPENDFDMTIFYPYRGTHIRDNIEKYDLQFTKHTGYDGVYKGKNSYAYGGVGTKSLTPDQIRAAQQRLLKEYKR